MVVDARLLDYVYHNKRLPLFQQNPRLDIAKFDFEVDFDVETGQTKCIMGGRTFKTLLHYPFFIHPYAHDNQVLSMIGELEILVRTAIHRERTLSTRLNLPSSDDHHSFIVKIEMETKRKQVDLEKWKFEQFTPHNSVCFSLFRSHRHLMDHMVFVEVLNDRLRVFAKYIKLTNASSINRQYVEECDRKVIEYGKWMENEFGSRALQLFLEFWSQCSPLDKTAASTLLNCKTSSLRDLFYYINEWNDIKM